MVCGYNRRKIIMWTMGSNNWIKYGWGEKLSCDWNFDDVLHMDFRNFTPPDSGTTVEDNAKIAVNNIIKSYPAPYTLMCSGGTDSQAMIWAWMVSKVPFNIVSIRYISEGIFFNEHDLVDLAEYAKKLNLTIEYKDFDVINFLENELPNYANEFDCDSPQICTHMKMSELVDSGTIMFGGNYLGIAKKDNQNKIEHGSKVHVAIYYTHLGLHRYSLKKTTETRTIIPFFLLHDPKFTLSFGFVCDTVMNNHTKNTIYMNSGIPVVLPEQKYTGFEKLKDYYDKYYNRVTPYAKLKFSSKPSNRVFDLLFRYPYENTGKWCKSSAVIRFF